MEVYGYPPKFPEEIEIEEKVSKVGEIEMKETVNKVVPKNKSKGKEVKRL